MHTALSRGALLGRILPTAPSRLLRPSRASWPWLLRHLLPEPVVPSLYLCGFFILGLFPVGTTNNLYPGEQLTSQVHEALKMELAWNGQGLGWARLLSKCQVLLLVVLGELEYSACFRTQEQKALVCLPAGQEP